MDLRAPHEGDWLLRAARRLARALEHWHASELEGAAHLPPGGALLVGNHGLFGLETPAFFSLLQRATGRYAIGLTDRTLFDNALVRPILARIGGVPGTRTNALRLLARGSLVVCYPGGSRETFKDRHDRGKLRWERSSGFALLAHTARVPVIPFAGLGVDDAWIHLGHARVLKAIAGRYAPPLAVGLGPFPLPQPFRFRLGTPIDPPSQIHDVVDFRQEVQAAVERLLHHVPATHDAPRPRSGIR